MPQARPQRRRPGRWRSFRSFVGSVYHQSAEDNIFFLASGITFNTLLAAIPFLLLVLSIAGILAQPTFREFQAPDTDVVLDWLWEIVPIDSRQVREQIGEQLVDAINSASSIGIVSGVLFVWFSTRLFGALRTALNEVFDVQDTRGIIKGKLDDIRLVLISTVLLTVNIAVSSNLAGIGIESLRRVGVLPGPTEWIVALAGGFGFIFLMYLLIYKFVPGTRLPWRTAAVAALFAAVGFELLKAAFGWYVAHFGGYSAVFFAFTTLIVVVIAAYYSAVVFVLGGEVGQEFQLRRAMRAQRETFD